MTPEDWTGLTDAQRAEKLAEALATIERRSTPHMTLPDRVCDCSFCSSAFAASILASYRASLEAAPVLDAEAGENGWRPIETAPKDGTPIIGHWEGYKRPCVMWFNFVDRAFESWADRNETPSHWMPLPAPPAAKEPR